MILGLLGLEDFATGLCVPPCARDRAGTGAAFVELLLVSGGGPTNKRTGRGFHVTPPSIDLYNWRGLAASNMRSSPGAPVIACKCTPRRPPTSSGDQDSPRSALIKTPLVSP